jgi:hypothetical protein
MGYGIMDWIQPVQNRMFGFCDHGIGISGFIKGGKFLDQLSDYQLLRTEDHTCWRLLFLCTI